MKTSPFLSLVAAFSGTAAFGQVENPNRLPAPADPRDRIPAGYTDGVIPAPNLPEGFTFMNGRVYAIHRGVMTPLQRELTVRISPSGTVTAFDGRTYPIPTGRVLTFVAAATPMPSVASSPGGAQPATAGTAVATPSNSSIGSLTTGGGNDFPFFVLPSGTDGILGVTGPGTGVAPGGTGTQQVPGAGISGQPMPNAANGINQPVSPGVTGNQQNTTGPQQIPAGQGNGAGTGNPPRNATGTGRTNPPSGTAPGRTGTTGAGAGPIRNQ